jgi:hypothetical protein
MNREPLFSCAEPQANARWPRSARRTRRAAPRWGSPKMVVDFVGAGPTNSTTVAALVDFVGSAPTKSTTARAVKRHGRGFNRPPDRARAAPAEPFRLPPETGGCRFTRRVSTSRRTWAWCSLVSGEKTSGIPTVPERDLRVGRSRRSGDVGRRPDGKLAQLGIAQGQARPAARSQCRCGSLSGTRATVPPLAAGISRQAAKRATAGQLVMSAAIRSPPAVCSLIG